MRILISGANGFLGSALCAIFHNRGHTILPIVRTKKHKNHIECNISSANKLLDMLDFHKPNIIINCAAKVDFSNNSKQEQYTVNSLAPAIIASWCAQHSTRLIQTSGTIVNKHNTTKFNNNSPEIAINNYGQTKLLADNMIRFSGCQYTIIRFDGIFGQGGPEHLGINRAINQAQKCKIPTIIGKGTALRNYIHVQDAAKLLVFCAENGITGTHYAGNHQSISIAQMLTDICDVYLDGVNPNYQDGDESIDQITEVSPHFPQTMPFKQALEAYQ